jgi:predicted glycosyltransferase
MTREAALLGTPTYTVSLAELAAVDAELIRRGLIVDLREPGGLPAVAKKPGDPLRGMRERRDAIFGCRYDAPGGVSDRR